MSAIEITQTLREALRQRHKGADGAPDRMVLLEEIRNATGFAASRACDAMAISFWPSDGLDVIGYEIKASRSDWRRELDAPEKAFSFSRYCDFWWIVAARDVVKPEEVPAPWGLLVPNAKEKLHPVVNAKRIDAEPMPRSMLASIVRAAAKSSWEPQLRAMRQELTDRAAASAERDNRSIRAQLDELKHYVERFEESSGITLRTYGEDPKHLGEVVRAVRGVLSAGYEGALVCVSGYERTLRRLADQCAVAAKEIEAMQSPSVEAMQSPSVEATA